MIQGVGSTSPASNLGRSATRSPDPDAASDKAKTQRATQQGRLTPEQQRQVAELQSRDREVRAHEAAHKAVGGSLAGGASFSYQSGPDGRRYAVGGEVSIDTGGERDPQATIAKMRQVVAAALAPAQPSSQDRAVAAAARATMAEAQRLLTSNDSESVSTRPDAARQQAEAATGYGPRPDEPGRLISLIA